MNFIVAELERPVSNTDVEVTKRTFSIADRSDSGSISHNRSSMSINKVIENPGNRETFTLHVKNLQYVPAHSFVDHLEYARYWLSTYNLSWLFPCYRGKHRERKQKDSTNVIHSINFKAKTGELIGILGSSVERFELVHLLTGRKKTGFFDGHISLTGGSINRSTFYYDNVAFVQAVSSLPCIAAVRIIIATNVPKT